MKSFAVVILSVTLGLGLAHAVAANPCTSYMKIQKVEFGNLDANGTVINAFGSLLYASDIRFLSPNLCYDGLANAPKSVTIYCKLYHPTGQLMTVPSSPPHYSFSYTVRVQPGKNNTSRLVAWGSATESLYTPGVYRFEVWCEEAMIYQTCFTLFDRANALAQGDWRTALAKNGEHPTVDCNNGYYKGDLDGGRRVGMGVYGWKSGSYYFGDWVAGDCTGYGMKISQENYYIPNCPDCVYYVGNWSSDKKEGYGYCYDRLGNLIYQGYFSNDRPTQTYPNRNNDSRKFEYLKLVSGNSYLGETVQGVPNGYGIFIWNNGDAWFGNWANGVRNGRGIMLNYSGRVSSGNWKDDVKL